MIFLLLKGFKNWRLSVSLGLLAIAAFVARNATWQHPAFGATYWDGDTLQASTYWSAIDGHTATLLRPSLQGWYWVETGGTHRWRLIADGSATLFINGEQVFHQEVAAGGRLREVVEVDLKAGANSFRFEMIPELPDAPPHYGTVLAIEEPRFPLGWQYLKRSRLYPNQPGSDPSVKTTPQEDQRAARQAHWAVLSFVAALIWLAAVLLLRLWEGRRAIGWRRVGFYGAAFGIALVPRVLLVFDCAARDLDFHYLTPGGDNYISMGRLALVGIYDVVGSRWGPGNILWAREWERWFGAGLLPFHLANAVIGAVMCAALADIAQRIFSWRAAKGTALLAAFFPPLILYQTSSMVEAMGTTVTGLMLWLMTIYLQRDLPQKMTFPALRLDRQFWLMLGLGLSLAVCGLFRPKLLIFALLLPITLWLRTRSLWQTAWRTLPVAAVAFAAVSPMTPLNPAFGDEGFIVTSGWQTIHMGNNETATGDFRLSVSYWSAAPRGIDRREAVLSSIQDSPRRAFQLFLRKVGLVWAGGEDGSLIDINVNGKTPSPFFALLHQDGRFNVSVLGFLGLVGMLLTNYRQAHGLGWMLPLGVLLFTLATAAVEGIARLRVQLFLLLAVGGGYALAALTEALAAWRMGWGLRLQKWGTAAVGAVLILLLFSAFEHYLPRPRFFSEDNLAKGTIPQNVVFDNAIKLIGYQPLEAIMQPNGVLAGRLYFARVGEVTHDYNVSVIALLPDGRTVSREDWALGCTGYPCPPPSEWDMGEGLRDEFFIQLPGDIPLSPPVIKLGVILYGDDGERFAPSGDAFIRGDKVAFLRHIGLISPDATRPTSVDMFASLTPLPQTFGDRFRLIAYTLDKTHLKAGESLTITLDWRVLRTADQDYGVFVHLVEDDFATLRGQVDGVPAHLGVELPTGFWSVGATIYDQYTLTVDPATPSGVYNLKIGFYSYSQPLRLSVTPGDGINSDGLLLARIEVR